jgi:hypothetical protein
MRMIEGLFRRAPSFSRAIQRLMMDGELSVDCIDNVPLSRPFMERLMFTAC